MRPRPPAADGLLSRRGRSSIGRAPPLQGGGCRFEPDRLHHRPVRRGGETPGDNRRIPTRENIRGVGFDRETGGCTTRPPAERTASAGRHRGAWRRPGSTLNPVEKKTRSERLTASETGLTVRDPPDGSPSGSRLSGQAEHDRASRFRGPSVSDHLGQAAGTCKSAGGSAEADRDGRLRGGTSARGSRHVFDNSVCGSVALTMGLCGTAGLPTFRRGERDCQSLPAGGCVRLR